MHAPTHAEYICRIKNFCPQVKRWPKICVPDDLVFSLIERFLVPPIQSERTYFFSPQEQNLKKKSNPLCLRVSKLLIRHCCAHHSCCFHKSKHSTGTPITFFALFSSQIHNILWHGRKLAPTIVIVKKQFPSVQIN